MLKRLSTYLFLITGFALVPAVASAHTVRICWKDVGPVTTFYAGTYHSPSEGPSPIGGIIIDGFEYPFSGWIVPASLPADVQCAVPTTGGTAPAVVHYQTFTSSFPGGPHSVSFTSTNVVQSPWGIFPALTFGGGACADADFDGQCNNVDPCPLDAANDGDGDGKCANVDNCPLLFNPGQTDANGNGQGDACEGQICGNGLVQGAEQCDDGNIAGGDGCSAICTAEIADGPPNANAGASSSVNEGQAVALDGSQSNDPDNDALTFAWVQISGPNVPLAGANTSQPAFTAPTVAVGGETLTFQLTVTANSKSDTDVVSVTVVNVNHPPVADAGDPQSVVEGAPVSLNGAESYDDDHDALTYAWVQVSGPGVDITGANTATPSFTAPIVGAGGAPGVVAMLVFKLSVNDGFTTPDVEDTVTIDVTNVNNAPTADAGTDMTLNENGAVQLNAHGSTDPDGDTLSYAWTQVGGPTVTLTDDATATPSFTTPFVNPGGTDLTFQVWVDDGYGGGATDTVIVHVQNANDPPLVSAAQPTIPCIWPPNHTLVQVGIIGVSDPEENANITITSVTQDEPTNGLGDGDTPVDAIINADGTVLLRAERWGSGDGRVYHIHFTASDLEGSVEGVVTVCVPRDRKSIAIDGGGLYDSRY
jgi:chitinase